MISTRITMEVTLQREMAYRIKLICMLHPEVIAAFLTHAVMHQLDADSGVSITEVHVTEAGGKIDLRLDLQGLAASTVLQRAKTAGCSGDQVVALLLLGELKENTGVSISKFEIHPLA